MSIQDKAMLVTLSVSCWTARKQDKKVTAEVEKAHSAHDAGRYNKLLVDKQYLDPLNSYAGTIRSYHYKMTMPWMDNGARLLPSKLFLPYSAEIRRHTVEYGKLVDKFLQEYPTLVHLARQRLGTMYDPDDYPSVQELQTKFGVETDITPVPSGSDFRVDLSDGERQRISEDITRKVAEREAAATSDAWRRVREVVGLVGIRLGADKAVIRDSLIENVRDLAELLPGMNVRNDPLMEKVCQQIIANLLVPPVQLRASISLRRKTAMHAQKILELCPQ